ncbi:hypothetical protein D3C73_464370 [compost metagenome]
MVGHTGGGHDNHDDKRAGRDHRHELSLLQQCVFEQVGEDRKSECDKKKALLFQNCRHLECAPVRADDLTLQCTASRTL